MTHPSPPPYRLAVDGLPDLRVHSFTGEETLSSPWRFDVVVTAKPGGERLEQTALAQRATLLFQVAAEPRAFYGIVSSARIVEVHHEDRSVKLLLRIVPRLWLLKRKRRTRIFQHLRVPEIVTAVLREAGIVTRWQLTRAYPEREYVTQYEETDERFVRRLLAEAGIYFSFFQGGPVDDAALAADAALGAAADVGGAVAAELGGQAVGALVGSAAQMAETLIPGDTVVCADDASAYAPVGGDDPAALAASTAAAMAPAVGDALGLGDGPPGAALGAASAVAGTAIAAATSQEAPVLTLLRNEEARVTTQDKILHFSLRNAVRSTAATFRDYDPDRPRVRLQSTAVSTTPFPPSPFEAAAMAAATAENVASTVEALVPLPGEVAAVVHEVEDVVDRAEDVAAQVGAALGQKVPYEIYEHHSPFLFPKWAFANDEAPKILRQERRRASIAAGTSGCSAFSPGHRFALRDHPAEQLDGGYVLTRVEHRGETHPEAGKTWRVYENRFECAPEQVTYVPPRPKRKSVQVMLTATVVGPRGEEIHVDERGRVKVQFHWDREGRHDDRSSCWIWAMQAWSGAGWGHQFIPRVGMEVVVTFEGGDPDKPLVLGAVPNGTHPVPFKLPEHKTMSGIRTSSSPGGRGSNEVSFEDRAGLEKVYVHAQRDYHEVVENNHTADVHGGKQTTVDRDLREDVRGSVHLHVEGGRAEDIGADDRLHVKGSVHRDLDRDERTTVLGSSSTTVHKMQAVEVRGAHSLTVGTVDDPTASDHTVYGTASLQASKQIVLHAEEGLRLVCGESSLEVLPDKIVLQTPTLELSASQSLTASAKDGGPSLTLGDEVEVLAKKVKIFTEGGALELDQEAKIAGKKIKLGYDPSKPEKKKDEAPTETKPLQCKLSDYWMEPYAKKRYHLTAEALRFEGETDGDGVITADIPKSATQALVRLWLSKAAESAWGLRKLYEEPEEQWARVFAEMFVFAPYGGPGQMLFGNGRKNYVLYLEWPAVYSILGACQHLTTYGALTRGLEKSDLANEKDPYVNGMSAGPNGSVPIFSSPSNEAAPKRAGWLPNAIGEYEKHDLRPGDIASGADSASQDGFAHAATVLRRWPLGEDAQKGAANASSVAKLQMIDTGVLAGVGDTSTQDYGWLKKGTLPGAFDKAKDPDLKGCSSRPDANHRPFARPPGGNGTTLCNVTTSAW